MKIALAWQRPHTCGICWCLGTPMNPLDLSIAAWAAALPDHARRTSRRVPARPEAITPTLGALLGLAQRFEQRDEIGHLLVVKHRPIEFLACNDRRDQSVV